MACVLDSNEPSSNKGDKNFPAWKEGNVLGTIYNPDGSRAVGAVVRLVSSGHVPFAPLAKKSKATDSVLTDEKGRFAFLTGDRGYYNLLAKGEKGVGFKDSIFIRDQAGVLLETTLETPGTVSGIAGLPYDSKDNSGIIILVLGTNLYTLTTDAEGRFQTPPLASGPYTLRLLTTKPGHGFLDVSVNIEEGGSGALPTPLILPGIKPKRLDSIAVTLDKVNMAAQISWPAFPPDMIEGYNIYRNTEKDKNRKLNSAPFEAPRFTDRVMGFEGSKISYIVTTVDRVGQETLPSPARSLSVESVFDLDSIRLLMNVLPRVKNPFAEDARGNFYVIDKNSLFKLNAMGKVLKEKPITREAVGVLTTNTGFVYLVTRSHGLTNEILSGKLYSRVHKYDTSLTQQLDSLDIRLSSSSVHVSPEGNLYAYGRYSSIIKTYDTAFTLVKTDSMPHRAHNLQVVDDTLLVQVPYWLKSASDPVIEKYDGNMTRLDNPVILPRLFTLFPGNDVDMAVNNILRTRNHRYVLSVRYGGNSYIVVLNKALELMGVKKTSSNNTTVYVNEAGGVRFYDRNSGCIFRLKL
jgi:hypothetical protein